MPTSDAQGHPGSESATNLPPNRDPSLSSQTLPPPHLYLPPPPNHFLPQSSQQNPSTLPDMTSLSSVPRYARSIHSFLRIIPILIQLQLPLPILHLGTEWTARQTLFYLLSMRGPIPIFRLLRVRATSLAMLETILKHPNLRSLICMSSSLVTSATAQLFFSPQPSSTSTTSSSYQRIVTQNKSAEDTPTRNHGSKQFITPESSPSYGSRTTPPLRTGFATTPTARHNSIDTGALTPRNVQAHVALDLAALAPSPHISSPISAASEQSSRLSSPFIAKLGVAEKTERSAKKKQTLSAPSSPIPMDVDDVFSSPPNARSRSRLTKQDRMDISTPPISPPQASTSTTVVAGGEIERIRQVLIEDHLAQIREAENRRPDYLKRSKRLLSDVDSTIFADERERERGFAVGITESPNKGRRLQLFQETSEESFEESLMAGGYGRYRTNDWVRQPQPLSVLGSGATGTPNVAQTLVERVEEAPPTEKELKKRKRLDAFCSSNKTRPKLTPVDLVGKGRVLLELPDDDKAPMVETPDSSPAKKRSGGGKRKRKSTDLALSSRKDKLLNPTEELEGPNWPDNEFPWRLRKAERSEAEKAMEDERLKWIEKFLDRDTDDEDDGESGSKSVAMSDDEILPSGKWGHVYEHETDKPVPVRMGRGKMVPLLAHPEDPRSAYARKKSVFPSDPADARAALLAKKSVRALAYRNQRRQREIAEQDKEDTVICICNGKDDGRELVQCDGCQTWYHLECIGIRSIAELGREEDAWFCRSCVTRVRSPSPERVRMPTVLREPTFVPTDDAPRVRRIQDPTLYQPLHNSPLWNPPRVPKTPTRGGRKSDFDMSSSSDSSRFPSTPQNLSHDIRLYNTPNPLEYHPSASTDDPPFDPNSTPSRGIKFGAFATPKSNPWSIRAGGLLHTPSRHHSRGSFGRSFGSLEDMGGSFGAFDGLTRYPNVEDSPIRRSAGREGGPRMKRVPESPLLSRPLVPLRPAPEESPVLRFQPQRDVTRLHGLTGPPSRDDSAYMR
ncbi:Transcription initiation factor TFIID subunit 3 [Leucoagaricus sp. SymC.cos]|nr:Transcription initiation factor TFIID subunit 3 [Leucoagaricus sp. SymC.cos]